MLFNSYNFVFLYLPLLLIALAIARRIFPLRVAVWQVGLASLIFYAVWDIRFLPLLLASITVNYFTGNRIISSGNQTAQKRWLILGITANLLAIGFFKYTGFILGNITAISGAKLSIPDIILPIGISFFTFTQIAFLVDAYRGHYKRNYPFSDYLLFVTFFPHLIAGPILIHKHVIPQFESERFGRPSVRTAYAGVVLFTIGLFKKVLIADNFAGDVEHLFKAAEHLSTFEAWLAALLYTLQLYFDFSGYSDMALGLAQLMNVRIPNNFNAPYKSTSITEFWRRWHISLSRFLRDYLYIPLGGNRSGIPRQLLNLFITMLLAGLWHGAGWTFVMWGGLHGVMLGINHLWRRTGITLPHMLGWAITFLSVMLAWVIFRAASLHDALAIFTAMLGQRPAELSHPLADNVSLISLAALLLTAWCVFTPPARWYAYKKHPSLLMALVFAFMLLVGIINIANPTTFIYFQF